MAYLAAVSLLWAFSFGLIGNALEGADKIFVATLRLACASLLFLPWLRPRSIGREDYHKLISCGAIQFGLMYVCYMKAYDYLPSHLVALFSILTPVYVVLIHDLRKGRFFPRYLLAALLSVLGAAGIRATTTPAGDFWNGFVLMQLAGLSFAYGQIAYRDWKRRSGDTQDHEVFALLALGGLLCAGLFSLALSDLSKLEILPSQWSSILYLGFVASGLGFFLWNKGATLSNPGTLAAFNNAVVPLAVLCSLFVFGEIEDSTPQELIRLVIGGVLVTGALFIGQKKSFLQSRSSSSRR